jgi:hypothetical protein
MTAGSNDYFANGKRKFQKHEVQQRKLDRRDRKLLRLAEKVEARKAEKLKLKGRPSRDV